MFIFTFFCSCFLSFFLFRTWSSQIQIVFKRIYLTCRAHHQIQLYVIAWKPLFFFLVGDLTSLQRIQYILSPADRVVMVIICSGEKKKMRIKLKTNIKKMQELSEGPDRKRGDACAERTLWTKERNPFSFSSDWWRDNTKIFLTADGRLNASVFRQYAG